MMDIEVTYDTKYKTWNVMYKSKCIFYGSVFELEEWLENHPEYNEIE